MFDVITFGSAAWDIFIRDKKISFKNNEMIFNKKSVVLPLGSKIDIDEINFSSGGGATNTAVSFSFLGFKTACCSAVGFDLAGNQILQDLKKFKVDTELMSRIKDKKTNHSIVFSVIGQDRTILAYRGASQELSLKNIPWKKIKAKWLYLSPLSGETKNCLKEIVDFGFRNKIKIAVNPGKAQLRMKGIKEILKKADILILNQEEAAFLTNLPYNKEREIVKKIVSFYPGIFVMTKGKRGAIACQDNMKYKVGIHKTKVVDRTGAGDSFGSGFVSSIISGNDIKKALELASANATGCLQEWGAKNGLLKKKDKFKRIKVEKYA
jgi:sugar/nucleoside kinase (ribokinase family)